MATSSSSSSTASGEMQAGQPEMGTDFNSIVDEMKAAFNRGGMEECMRVLERKRDEWKDTPLNVAVIGNSGVGKSSYINAIRGLIADDEGAAEVGCVQTTVEPRSYPHPDNEKLKFWDLPGVGTGEFPRASYLEKIDVDRFDFFLLMTADRFTENDTWLCEEIRKREKKCFFIRTKMQVDISNNQKAHPRTHNENDVVDKIRQTTAAILRTHECDDVPIFLIDNYELNKFDFEKLKLQLIEDFPRMKRSALILSLTSSSVEMIKLKGKELRSRIWKMAALSSAAAAIPIPGLSIVVDIGILVGEAMFYFQQLGLDCESLQRYAALYSADHARMHAHVVSALGIRTAGAVTTEAMKTIVMTILTRAAPVVAVTAAEESAKVFLPIIGSLIAAPLSFIGTYIALRAVLNMFEKVAIEAMQCQAPRDAMQH